MTPAARPRPLVLCIVDGFGVRRSRDGNAFALAHTPRLDALTASCPTTSLSASGTELGHPAGQAGDGYLGHLTLGAGRAVTRDCARIDEAKASRKLGKVPMLAQTLRIALDRASRLHLIGLISDRSSHASMDHLYGLLGLADFQEIPVVVHAILDGRDMAPRSAMPLLDRLLVQLEDRGTIGTISGRAYSLDAGEDWDRVYALFHAMVRDRVLGPTAQQAETAFDALSLAYGQGQVDGTVVPTRIGEYGGMQGDFLCDFAAEKPVWEWTGEEVGLAFHHRPDGLRPLVAMLTKRDLPAEVANDLLMDRDKPVLPFEKHCFACLTDYDPALAVPVAFDRQPLGDTCGELVARAGLEQLRLAESVKRAHVTEFFSGGQVAPFDGERRRIIASAPVLDLADPQPRPRTTAVCQAAVDAVASGQSDFILVNFSGPEMMARTGDLDATIDAVQTLDTAIGALADRIREVGGALLLTSDHGNCELMGEPAGELAAAHTANEVPLIYVNDEDRDARLLAGGRLTDVAPTVLQLLGIEQPTAMTGRSLLSASAYAP